MTLTTFLLGALAATVLLAASAFFSSSETAIFSLPTADTPEEPQLDRRTDVLASLRADPHRLLVTILVGNTIVNVGLTSIVTILVAQATSAGVTVVLATALSSVLVLVFGEIVPKAYGLGNAEEWSLRVAGPIRLLERLASPVITVFEAVTRRIAGLLGGELAIERPYLD